MYAPDQDPYLTRLLLIILCGVFVVVGLVFSCVVVTFKNKTFKSNNPFQFIQ